MIVEPINNRQLVQALLVSEKRELLRAILYAPFSCFYMSIGVA